MKPYFSIKRISTIIFATTFLVLSGSFLSCGEKHDTVALKGKRESLPRLKAYNISTVVSDSGITRYRMTTPELLIFDRAKEPYSEFPKGVYLERFNDHFKADAKLSANKAIFYERTSLWKLNGKVKVTNLQGEVFETEELFWNQAEKKIYTDQFMKITQEDRVITGLGFESNQAFTKYIIRHPKAIIPLGRN